MALLDLGLSDGPSYTSSDVGVLIYEREDSGAAGRDLRLVWTSQVGSEAQESFWLNVAYRGRRKGMEALTEWRSATATVPASQCHETLPRGGGRTWWSHDLNLGGMLASLTGSGRWRYDTRLYDGIELRVSIFSTFNADFAAGYGYERSEVASAELYVSYVPEYEITSVYYERSDLVVIEYGTTWTRLDDRFGLEEGGCYDVSTRQGILRGLTWGSVAGRGRIELPTSQLTRHIKGRATRLEVRFNPSYRPQGWEFARATWQGVVGDRTVCNTPTLSTAASADPYAVAVYVGDSGDRGNPCTKATVKLVGGKYSCDEVTVPVPGVATLRFPPLNEVVSVEAVGMNALGATSARAFLNTRKSVKADGVVVLDSIAGSCRALIRWNEKLSVTSKADCDLVRLAGRRRPSAFYGEGGSTTVSVQAALLDEDGRGLEAMPESGDVMLRIYDGRRYAIAADVKLSWGYDTAGRVKTVEISGEEVDA